MQRFPALPHASLRAIAGLVLLAALITGPAVPTAKALASAASTGPSGLPLPRYVSLKSSRVNMRIGPGRSYQIQWLYLRRGLPMEIIQESGNWRKVRDPQGNEGWILHSLLSGNRTAIVAPWLEEGTMVEMRASPTGTAPLSARLEPGVIAAVRDCRENWCQLSIRGMRGYVDRRNLWGVYPDERF